MFFNIRFDCIIDAIYEATQRAAASGNEWAIFNRDGHLVVAPRWNFPAADILEVFQP